MKKHISSMLHAQAKSAKNNAMKDELLLLQVKLMVAKKLQHVMILAQRTEKAEILLSKLQRKWNEVLDDSSCSGTD